MTAPTISYGHIALHDLDSVTNFSETDVNNIATWASDGDVITVTVTPTANAQTAQYEYDHTSTVTTTSLSKILCRFKTSVSSGGVKAGLKITFTDASTQTIDLGFNTSWKCIATALTTSRTIDKIALVVTASGWTVGTHYVYFDFYLACKGVFTFPFVSGLTDLEMAPRDADIAMPNRDGDVTHAMGTPSCPIHIQGEMNSDADWQGANSIIGEILYDIYAHARTEAFQWLTSDLGDMKVRMKIAHLGQSMENAQRVYDVTFKEYRKSCASGEQYFERFGLLP